MNPDLQAADQKLLLAWIDADPGFSWPNAGLTAEVVLASLFAPDGIGTAAMAVLTALKHGGTDECVPCRTLARWQALRDAVTPEGEGE